MSLADLFISPGVRTYVEAYTKGKPSCFFANYSDGKESYVIDVSELIDEIVESKNNSIEKDMRQLAVIYHKYYDNSTSGYHLLIYYCHITGTPRDDPELQLTNVYDKLNMKESELMSWKRLNKMFISSDTKIAENIVSSAKRYAKIYRSGDIPPFGDLEVSVSKLQCEPMIVDGDKLIKPTASDNMRIFMDSTPNIYVPYISTSVDGVKHTKIIRYTEEVAYNPSSLSSTSPDIITESRISISHIVEPPSAKTLVENGTIATLWLEDPERSGSTYTGRRNGMIGIRYSPGIMNIKLPPFDKKRISTVEEVKYRLSSAFGMNFDNIRATRFRASFTIFNTNVSDRKLIKILQSTEIYKFFTLRGIPEEGKPLENKYITAEVTQQHVGAESGVSILAVKGYCDTPIIVNIEKDYGVPGRKYGKREYPKGTQFYKFDISNGISKKSLRKIIATLRVILRLASEDRTKESKAYDYIETIRVSEVGMPLTHTYAEKMGIDTIPPNYGTICSSRPVIASIKSKNAVSWPRDGPNKIKLLSPDPEKPYIITVYKTTNRKDSDSVVVYPSCSKTPEDKHIDQNPGRNNSNETTLSPGMLGDLHASVSAFLSVYDSTDYKRLGVEQKPYSILVCINTALKRNNPVKKSLKDIERMRSGVDINGNELFLEVGKQQMYDMDIKEIKKRISKEYFIDPVVMYSIIQEYYGINLVIFRSSKYLEEATLTRPRCYDHYCIGDIPDRPTVVVVLHVGTRFSSSSFLHCELVVSVKQKSNSINTLFDRDLSIFTWKNIKKIYVDNVWDINKKKYTGPGYGRSYRLTLGIEPTGQLIDNRGKSIIYEFKLKKKTGIILVEGGDETLNIPSITPPFTLFDLSDVQRLEKEPYAIDIVNKKLVGLWYKVKNIHYSAYIPINPSENNPYDLPVQNNYSFGRFKEVSIQDKILKLGYYNMIYKSIIEWFCIILIHNGEHSKIENYIIHSGDQDLINMDDIPCQLPGIKSISKALKWLAYYTSGVVGNKNGRLFIQTPSVRNRDYLIKYAGYRIGYHIDNETEPSRINLDYVFKHRVKHSKSLVFINETEYSNWLMSSNSDTQKLYTTISNHNLSLTSYVYQKPDGSCYLIQNFDNVKKKKSSYYKSLMVSSVWIDTGVNLGYDPYLVENGNKIGPRSYVQKYGISSVNVFKLINNKPELSQQSDDKDDRMMILDCGDSYASMLAL